MNDTRPVAAQASRPQNGNGSVAAARVLDLGVSNGPYGERFFLNVAVGRDRARLFGSAKKIADALRALGETIPPEELGAGMRFNLPCRVTTERSADGPLSQRHPIAADTDEWGTEVQRMTPVFVSDPGEKPDSKDTPHFSNSQLQKYLTCPQQYRLHYLENFRPRVVSASLVFGSVMHLALAEYFRQGHDPAASFEREWQALKGIEMRYSRKETWDFLHSPESHCSKHFTANTRRGSRALCWKTAGSDFGLDRMGRLMAQSAPKSWTLVRRRAP